jgi:hypothetical protein
MKKGRHVVTNDKSKKRTAKEKNRDNESSEEYYSTDENEEESETSYEEQSESEEVQSEEDESEDGMVLFHVQCIKIVFSPINVSCKYLSIFVPYLFPYRLDFVYSRQKSRRKATKTPVRSVKRSATKGKLRNGTPKTTNTVSPKTPKSRRKSRLSFATPCIPVRAQGCKTPVTPLQRARARYDCGCYNLYLYTNPRV